MLGDSIGEWAMAGDNDAFQPRFDGPLRILGGRTHRMFAQGSMHVRFVQKSSHITKDNKTTRWEQLEVVILPCMVLICCPFFLVKMFKNDHDGH